MFEDRAAGRAMMEITVPLVANIWHARGDSLAPYVRGDSALAEQSAETLDTHLREVLQTIHSLSDHAIIGWLRSTSSVSGWLPTWQPLLFSSYEVFVTRYGSVRANQLLVGMNTPRRDTMVKSTGNLPNGSNADPYSSRS